MRTTHLCVLAAVTALVGCGGEDAQQSPAQRTAGSTTTTAKGARVPKTYAEDVAFLKAHTKVIELGGGTGPGVVIVPAYQGRVMTSTFDSARGEGIGWINYDVVEEGKPAPHITVYGGEDRIWLGPEGGQFSIFFKEGSEQDLDAWQTPAFIDSEPYEVVSQSSREATFSKKTKVTNYSGTEFDIEIERTVAMLDEGAVKSALGVDVPADVRAVAYETRNTLKNAGANAWTKEGGLLSVWILSMYKHSPTTSVVVPFDASATGTVVNDDYFGKVPADRLVTKDGYLVFKADGQYRSKIGVPPQRAKDVLGSWDPGKGVLTIVKYNQPRGTTEYVNSKWAKHQDDPFAGDAVNSYNDGPPEPGKKPLGPFYELETSSPALALKPGGSYMHAHRTFHLTGPKASLQTIATAVLGVDLDEVATAFTK